VFVRLGDVVRALRALEARGGSAHLALFELTWGPYAYAALGLALDGASSWSRWRRGYTTSLHGHQGGARAGAQTRGRRDPIILRATPFSSAAKSRQKNSTEFSGRGSQHPLSRS